MKKITFTTVILSLSVIISLHPISFASSFSRDNTVSQIGLISKTTIYNDEMQENGYLIAQVSFTPEGSADITVGNLKGTKVNYSDPRSKHTKFPKYSQSQLEQAVKSPNGKLESQFSQAVKDKDVVFGGQLNLDAISKYQTLVKDGVEKGTAAKGKYFYEASFTVGVDIATGKGTKKYRLDSVPNGAHVIPYEYTSSDLK
jgi:hypothetical protein